MPNSSPACLASLIASWSFAQATSVSTRRGRSTSKCGRRAAGSGWGSLPVPATPISRRAPPISPSGSSGSRRGACWADADFSGPAAVRPRPAPQDSFAEQRFFSHGRIVAQNDIQQAAVVQPEGPALTDSGLLPERETLLLILAVISRVTSVVALVVAPVLVLRLPAGSLPVVIIFIVLACHLDLVRCHGAAGFERAFHLHAVCFAQVPFNL